MRTFFPFLLFIFLRFPLFSQSPVTIKQEIALIGVSGSSFLPHLHFEVRTDISHKAEGLTSSFSDIQIWDGKVKRKLKYGSAETGTIIETQAK